MTKTESERLTRMEDNQDNFAKALDRLTSQLEIQGQKLDELNSKFDNLAGGKQALMWLTGIALTISGLVIAALNLKKK